MKWPHLLNSPNRCTKRPTSTVVLSDNLFKQRLVDLIRAVGESAVRDRLKSFCEGFPHGREVGILPFKFGLIQVEAQ